MVSECDRIEKWLRTIDNLKKKLEAQELENKPEAQKEPSCNGKIVTIDGKKYRLEEVKS